MKLTSWSHLDTKCLRCPYPRDNIGWWETTATIAKIPMCGVLYQRRIF